MGNRLTIGNLALLMASTAMAGAIYSGAQAAEKIDCNSGLAQIALASQQGGEEGIWESYAHCVDHARQMTSDFVGTSQREARSQADEAVEHAWPDQSYPTD